MCRPSLKAAIRILSSTPGPAWWLRAGTPRAIVEQLNAAINDGLKSQSAQDSLAKFSAIAKLGTPEDFKTFLAEQMRKWGAIVHLAGARID